jgi:pimeloyl-ACP methyl ester carboxylesterase
MTDIDVDGVRLFYEERGGGTPICCVHGVGGSSAAWQGAIPELARLGRVITYDRRGSGRTQRLLPPRPVTMTEHAEDLSQLLPRVAGEPAVVIGRSYGGGVAVHLALRHTRSVRALVLLEPAVRGLSADYDAWDRQFDASIAAAADSGVDAAAERFLLEVFGETYQDLLPARVQQLIRANASALVADCTAPAVPVDAAALATIEVPVLVLRATSSLPALQAVAEAVASTVKNGRLERVAGSHLIDPASPAVLSFLDTVLHRVEEPFA